MKTKLPPIKYTGHDGTIWHFAADVPKGTKVWYQDFWTGRWVRCIVGEPTIAKCAKTECVWMIPVRSGLYKDRFELNKYNSVCLSRKRGK